MKKLMVGVFVFGLTCFGLVAFAANEIYKTGVAEGIKMGRGSINLSRCNFAPAPSQEEMDNTCITWLMESNLKKAKQRICGKQ